MKKKTGRKAIKKQLKLIKTGDKVVPIEKSTSVKEILNSFSKNSKDLKEILVIGKTIENVYMTGWSDMYRGEGIAMCEIAKAELINLLFDK